MYDDPDCQGQRRSLFVSELKGFHSIKIIQTIIVKILNFMANITGIMYKYLIIEYFNKNEKPAIRLVLIC